MADKFSLFLCQLKLKDSSCVFLCVLLAAFEYIIENSGLVQELVFFKSII